MGFLGEHNYSFGKLTNIILLIAVISFVGSLAFAITRTPETTGSSASTDTLDPAHLAAIPPSTAFLTRTITQYPRSYNSIPISSGIYTEAERSLFIVEPTRRKTYIINRVALYYIIRDVLKENSISFNDAGENPTFAQIEQALGPMKSAVDQNLLSTADFAFVKAYFATFTNDDKARKVLGENLQPKALELMEKYRLQFTENPTKPEEVVTMANEDAELQILTNGEHVEYFKDYFADINNVPEQDNYIYDEEFDEILFALSPNEVSPVISLNSQSPYMYIVIYPTRINLKKYQSLKDIVADKLSLVGY